MARFKETLAQIHDLLAGLPHEVVSGIPRPPQTTLFLGVDAVRVSGLLAAGGRLQRISLEIGVVEVAELRIGRLRIQAQRPSQNYEGLNPSAEEPPVQENPNVC